MEKISVIIPCLNEQESLPAFEKEINRIAEEMDKVKFEYIYINDGSTDNTLNILKDMAKRDKRVKYVSFSRRFGKEAGNYAGLKSATGDYAVIIDADLQHDPELLKVMYDGIKNEGYDSVAVRRTNRKGEKKIRSFFSKMFYKIIKKMSDVEIVDGATDYRMMTKQMYTSVVEMSEYNRFTKGLFSWVGFNTKWIEQENIERKHGTTSWSFMDLVLYSFSGITAFSTKPLLMSSFIGGIFCLISFLMIIFIIVKTLIFGDPVAGYPSLVCFIFFIGGVQLFCLGIVGEYLSKMYMEAKNRPLYIVKETNVDEKNNWFI